MFFIHLNNQILNRLSTPDDSTQPGLTLELTFIKPRSYAMRVHVSVTCATPVWCACLTTIPHTERKTSSNAFFALFRLVDWEMSRTPHPWEWQVVSCTWQYRYLDLPKRPDEVCVWVCEHVEMCSVRNISVLNKWHPSDDRKTETEKSHPLHTHTHIYKNKGVALCGESFSKELWLFVISALLGARRFFEVSCPDLRRS